MPAADITRIYDCVTAIDKPGVPRARVQRQIDDGPSLCERPKLYLGPARKAPEMGTIAMRQATLRGSA